MFDPGPQKAPASLARIKAQLQSILAEIEELTDPPDPSPPAKELKVGDRVKSLIHGGRHGTVTFIENDEKMYRPVQVDLDEGHCYWLKPEELELLEDQPSVPKQLELGIDDEVVVVNTFSAFYGMKGIIEDLGKTDGFPVRVNIAGKIKEFKLSELEQLP